MKSIVEYITEELHDVIVKVGDYWRIKGYPGKGTNTPKLGYWKAKYKTKEKAEAALKAYFANKQQNKNFANKQQNKNFANKQQNKNFASKWFLFIKIGLFNE